MRGGKREGAGRKAQGITRKVSLTLTTEEWAQIDDFDGTVAAFLRQQMQQQKQKADGMVPAFWKQDAEKYLREVLQLTDEITVLNQELERSNQKQNVDRLTRRDVERLWQVHLEKGEQHTPEALEEAYNSLIRQLFPSDGNLTEIKTQPQYICPFTNKRFGSPDSLVRAAIPKLIESAEHYLKERKEAEERNRVKEEDKRYWQQYISTKLSADRKE